MRLSQVDQSGSAPRRSRAVLATMLIALAVAALGAGSAQADTTHPFLGYIDLANGSNPQPIGVDDAGNLIVWLNDQKAVAKYDINGNPVNFTGLGTNMIDGKGGYDCPNTPSDCDRVPTEGFRETDPHFASNTPVAIDHSGSPAHGYIYVENNQSSGDQSDGEIDVFSADGTFKGTINQAQPYPQGGDVDVEGQESVYTASQGIAVGPDGVLYTVHPMHAYNTVNRYAPVDGNPAHSIFAGQTRTNCYIAGCQVPLQQYSQGAGVIAGRNYVYVGGYDRSHPSEELTERSGGAAHYMRYKMKEFFRQGLLNAAETDDFRPGIIFGNDGYYPPFNSHLSTWAMDPVNEHVYLGEGWAGIQEWDLENHQVGPMFGGEGCPGSPARARVNRSPNATSPTTPPLTRSASIAAAARPTAGYT